jgi:hypothetical protein
MFKSEDPNKPCWMSRSVDMPDPEGRRTLKSISIPIELLRNVPEA